MPTQERFRARPAWACLEPCPVSYKFRVLLWTAAEAANLVAWLFFYIRFLNRCRFNQTAAVKARIADGLDHLSRLAHQTFRETFDRHNSLPDVARMNLATKAPNFTRENAGEMARRATVSRLARIAREREQAAAAARAAAPVTDDARKQATLRQLDKLDVLIDAALDKCKQDDFLRLSAAKERLWKLVQPTAGALKPQRNRPRPFHDIQPVELTPQAPER